MNLLQRMCSSLGFSIKTKVVQEKTFFCGNCPPGRIKLMAAVVLLPCFLETSFAEPGKVLAKDYDSLAVSWERFNKDVTDIFNSGWVFEFRNFSGKRGNKLSGGIREVFQPEKINPSEQGDSRGEYGEDAIRNGGNKFDEIVNALLQGFIIGIIPLIPIFMKSPNAKLRCASRDSCEASP